MSASLTAVVLNWNGADDTLECLKSLRASTTRVRTIVVDNGSADDSVSRIVESGLADRVIQCGENLGYATGNNVGIRSALDEGADVVAVLNNDTVVDPGAFAALIRELPPDTPRAVSPEIRYYDAPERSWFAGGVVDRGWPRHLLEGELVSPRGTTRPTEILTGCCIAARAATWTAVGLFDPAYFLIFEDSDWSLRARRRGAQLVVVPDAVVLHKVSRSFGAPEALLGNFYFVRNGLRFELRYAPRHCGRFLVRWLLRPTAGSIVRRRRRRDLAYRWLGLAAWLTAGHGRAPTWLERRSRRRA